MTAGEINPDYRNIIQPVHDQPQHNLSIDPDINTSIKNQLSEENKSDQKNYPIFNLHKNHRPSTPKPDNLRKRKVSNKSFKAKSRSSAKLNQGKVANNSIVKYLITDPMINTLCDQVDHDQSDLQTISLDHR